MERVERQLAGQGMNPDTYLQMQGKTRDEIIEDDSPTPSRSSSASRCLSRSPRPRTSRSPTPSSRESSNMAGHERTTAAKPLERLRRDGRDSVGRRYIRVRKAIDVVADAAKEVKMSAEDSR